MHYLSRPVVPKTVLEHGVEIVDSFLCTVVIIALQPLLNGTKIHWVLDYVIVVLEIQYRTHPCPNVPKGNLQEDLMRPDRNWIALASPMLYCTELFFLKSLLLGIVCRPHSRAT